MLRLPLLALLLACLSCGAVRPVHFSSEPPGARLLVDGEDSGFVTPVALDLVDRKLRTVEFVLPGYATATRFLTLQDRSELVLWKDSQLTARVWRFPFWLNTEDFFIPLKDYSGESPARVFVRLQRAN
jgi:hypothetical protein